MDRNRNGRRTLPDWTVLVKEMHTRNLLLEYWWKEYDSNPWKQLLILEIILFLPNFTSKFDLASYDGMTISYINFGIINFIFRPLSENGIPNWHLVFVWEVTAFILSFILLYSICPYTRFCLSCSLFSHCNPQSKCCKCFSLGQKPSISTVLNILFRVYRLNNLFFKLFCLVDISK